MAPVSRHCSPFVFTWASVHPQAPHFYIIGQFCYCHLSFQTSKNTERSQISTLTLAMHCPSNGAGFRFFSRMNQKPGILGRYLNSTRQYEVSVLNSDLSPHLGSSASTFSNREDRLSFMKSPYLPNWFHLQTAYFTKACTLQLVCKSDLE